MGSLKKGVLLLALGHDNYFQMAVNLAASIKHNSPDVRVAIINDGKKQIDSGLFDHSIIVEPTGALHAYKTKLYDLTPFDKTLFLDVDMIAIPQADFTGFIKELDGVPFTMMNVKKEACIWADPEEVRAVAKNYTDPMYMLYSELFYFEKGKVAKGIFAEAAKQMNCTVSNRKFAGAVADELAFTLALMKLGVMPHIDDWLPVFWYFRSRKEQTKQPYQLKGKYIAYSIGGNSNPAYVKASYNNLALFYGQKMNVAKPYKVIDKRLYLPSRTKI